MPITLALSIKFPAAPTLSHLSHEHKCGQLKQEETAEEHFILDSRCRARRACMLGDRRVKYCEP